MKHARDEHEATYEAPSFTVLGPVAAFTFQGSPGGGLTKGGTKNDQNVTTNKL